MTDDRQPTLQERLRPVCAVLGGIGAVLSVLASFVAVEVSADRHRKKWRAE